MFQGTAEPDVWLLVIPERATSLYAAEPLEPAIAPELERSFTELAERWRQETAVMSSATMMAMHPAYQRIIGMGERAVPLILRELEREPDHWFWALGAITGENPVPPEDAGDVEKMAEAWIDFGRRRGYLDATCRS